MKLSELSPEQFVDYMRRKRERLAVEVDSSEVFDFYEKDFVGGVHLRIRRKLKKNSGMMFVKAGMHEWGIFVQVPRAHLLYGKKLSSEMLRDIALAHTVDYQYAPELDAYLMGINYAGTAAEAKNVGHILARRVAHTTAKPTSDGVSTTTKSLGTENLTEKERELLQRIPR